MRCPFCGKNRIIAKDEHDASSKNSQCWKCPDCGKRFTSRGKITSKLTKIRKRDGKVVGFDQGRITEAIWKAIQAVGGKDKDAARELSNEVMRALELDYSGVTVPAVEKIQDVVEKTLVKNCRYRTAKAYILYRKQREKLRNTTNVFVNVKETINNYLDNEDWRIKENSNEAYSFSGLVLHMAGKFMANYALNEIYTQDVSDAHRLGQIHIHDLNHGIIAYCCGHSLRSLIMLGFGGVKGKADCKPARHLSTLVHQMVNYIGCLQMEFAGAQAFSSMDTFMAPFVREDGLNYTQVEQAMQQFVFSLNIPSRWGSQYPFSNLTFDLVPPEDLRNQKAVVGGKEMDYTYGDCQKEMDMINMAFLEVMCEGDANGRTFSFPIPTYNLTRDFDWDGNIAKKLFETAAKYGTPYFQNYIGSDLDPSSIRAMCCRLQMNLAELVNRPGGQWNIGESTGSIGVVTVNLNRAGYEAENEEEFFRVIGRRMELAKQSLETKRKIIEQNMKNGLMPYTKRYLGTFRNHFSTIGLCGMNEACVNLLGKDITTPEGKQLAIDTLSFMREKTRDFQQETGNLYNLEATPAESTAYRLGKLDREMCPGITTSGKDAPYLTNSTQLPVDYTADLFTAIEHQDDIQPLYTGGTIFHVLLGESMSGWKSAGNLVRKIAENTRLPYFSLTPTFSVCPDHGYINGEQWTCPEPGCGKECEVYSRIVGYYRPVQNWNSGKQAEFKDRKTFRLKGGSLE